MDDEAGPRISLFSYGTLRQENVQLATFGRRLAGRPDALAGYALSPMPIDDPEVVATSGLAVHNIARPSGDSSDSIPGTLFVVTPAELEAADRYEVDGIVRVSVRLASAPRHSSMWPKADGRLRRGGLTARGRAAKPIGTGNEMKSAPSLAAIAALLLASSAAVAKPARGLEAECARVTEIYPLLMLVVMGEGPMNCGTSDDGSDYVDCHANETPQEKAARLRRLAVRQYQEAAYKKASDACDAWQADKQSAALRDSLAAAIAEARAADRGVLPATAP